MPLVNSLQFVKAIGTVSGFLAILTTGFWSSVRPLSVSGFEYEIEVLIAHQLSDRYGRLFVLSIAIVGQLLMCVLLFFSVNCLTDILSATSTSSSWLITILNFLEGFGSLLSGLQ